MGTLSVRQIARDYLGTAGELSINSNVYGYIFREADGSVFGTLAPGDILPGFGHPRMRSLRRHLETIAGRSTDLVIIFVGYSGDDDSGVVTRDQMTKIQYAIQIVRDLYAQVDIGIRKIDWRWISPEKAGGYITIGNRGEAQDLTDDFSGPEGGIDVFVVQSIDGAGGWSSIDGPCDKSSKFDLSGVVIELSNSRRFTGILLGHELGHYLGLDHGDRVENLMGIDSHGDGVGELSNTSTAITNDQEWTMRGHCSMRGLY